MDPFALRQCLWDSKIGSHFNTQTGFDVILVGKKMSVYSWGYQIPLPHWFIFTPYF